MSGQRGREFTDVVQARVAKIQSILSRKAGEYAQPEDRFHNFHLAAQIGGESPREALWGMAKKHLVSVMDLVHCRIPDHFADEKIGDLINYLILLEGLIDAERDEGEGREMAPDPFP